MAEISAEKKLEILKRVKDLAKKNYQSMSEEKDTKDAENKLAELDSTSSSNK